MSSKYLSLSDVAKEVGISRPSLYPHMRRGHLKSRKVGHYTVVSEADFLKFKSGLRRVKLGASERIVYDPQAPAAGAEVPIV